ncbi:MAG: polysaccharide pyruvyl transferase family protein [Clostridiaceae bacterium]|nr:polysaccharide pyruvyl transferase family protein [Clostridiaceae bacterium]
MTTIKAHYFNPASLAFGGKNFGDMLVPIILEWLGYKTRYVEGKVQGKLLCIGSELAGGQKLQKNDVVWGYGAKFDKPIAVPSGATILSMRGPMTAKLVQNYTVPKVYGDPAVLLPLIYKQEVTTQYDVGVVPHYIDKPFFKITNHHLIDIQSDPYSVIDEICKCRVVVCTSMHAAIVAESYGVPAVWLKVSDKIGGLEFKWNDYLMGTGRPSCSPVVLNGTVTDKNIDKVKDKVLPVQNADRQQIIDVWSQCPLWQIMG